METLGHCSGILSIFMLLVGVCIGLIVLNPLGPEALIYVAICAFYSVPHALHGVQSCVKPIIRAFDNGTQMASFQKEVPLDRESVPRLGSVELRRVP